MNKFILTLIISCFSSLALGTGQPVFDQANLATALDQYERMKDQLNELKNQVAWLEKQNDALTEIEDYDDFFKFVKDSNDYWDWSPTMQELMDIAGGDYGDNSLSEKIKMYNLKYGEAWDPSDFDPDYDGDSINYNAILYSDQANAARSALGISHEAYDRTLEFYELYEDQRDKIGEIDTLKKSSDYNNHLQLELAAQLNDMIKIMSQQLSMMALMLKQQDTTNEFNTNFFQSADYE